MSLGTIPIYSSSLVRSFLRKISILSVVLFLYAPESFAESVGRLQAEKMVSGWLKVDIRPLGARVGQTVKKTDTFTSDTGEILYYVVYLEPNGFVITAADSLAEPIICFAEKGQYNPSTDNPLGALVSRDLPARIDAVKKFQSGKSFLPEAVQTSLESATGRANARWKELTAYADDNGMVGTLGLASISDMRVEPLVASQWGQTTIGHIIGYPACYNYYTPPNEEGDPDNYPCGCVATAMAQVMRCYQHPASYNWSNMPLVPDLSTTDSQRQAIGDVCFDAAESVDTIYSEGGSSAQLSKASTNLKSSFNYSNSIYSLNTTLGTSFYNMVNPNLDADKPVILGLSGEDVGHAVICDGYGYDGTTLYHHLNMGWDGLDDAWYNLPIVDAVYDFDDINGCVYNIFISGTGEIVSGRVVDLAGNPILDVSISAKAPTTTTYYATTNSKGIYAFINLPSSKTYTVKAARPPYTFLDQIASVGKSTDNQSTSGNKWAVNFAVQNAGPPIAYNQNVEVLSGSTEIITLQATDEGLPDPPGQMQFIITALPTQGRLTDPAAGLIKTVPYTLAGNGNTVEYQSCSYYVGGDSIEFVANDYGTAPSGGDSSPATVALNVSNVMQTTFAPSELYDSNWPLLTGSNQGRTQVIYLASDIGAAKRLTDLAIEIDTAPGQMLNNWTIRMKHTSQTQYSSHYFETSGWTTVYVGNEQPMPIGWRYFHFQNTFDYNGSSNLMIDFSFNNSSSSSDGFCIVSDTGNTRVIMSYGSTVINPINWTDANAPGLWGAEAVPNIKLTGLVPAAALAGDFEPDCDVDTDDLQVFIASWLREDGQPSYNEKCDIFKPIDGIIDFNDLAVLARNWLADRF